MDYEPEFTDQFEEWFDSLTRDQQLAIEARVKVLRLVGPNLGEPTVKKIERSKLHRMKELRCSEEGVLRILYLFGPLRWPIFLIGGDKTGQWQEWYDENIPYAEELYAVYLQELKDEGLLP